jgi:cell division protein ZipA
MEVTTIVGIVITICIILWGLRIMFKQPDDGATSLDSELHLDPDSQQPIIPRHARDQLKTEDITEEVKTEEVLVQEKAPIKKRPTHSLVELQQAILEKEQQAAEQEKAEQEKAEQAKIVTSQQMVTERRTPSTEQVAKEIAQTPSIQPQVDTVVTETISDTAVQQDVILQESIQSENSKQESSQRNTLNQDVSSRDVLNQDVLNPDILNQDISISEIDDFEGESSILDLHLNEQQRYDDESVLANAENIIALNVYPNIRFALSGDKTLKILLKYGLRYGEMACFHRYEQIDEPSQLMFSVLRITDEGHAGFDLETLSTEQVQGLAFFLALPHNDVQKGYDTMVSIAGLIAREIDGTVYDENNLEFTPQLKEHWRHQAIDYRSAQEA